jgi:hypothetical protein
MRIASTRKQGAQRKHEPEAEGTVTSRKRCQVYSKHPNGHSGQPWLRSSETHHRKFRDLVPVLHFCSCSSSVSSRLWNRFCVREMREAASPGGPCVRAGTQRRIYANSSGTPDSDAPGIYKVAVFRGMNTRTAGTDMRHRRVAVDQVPYLDFLRVQSL